MHYGDVAGNILLWLRSGHYQPIFFNGPVQIGKLQDKDTSSGPHAHQYFVLPHHWTPDWDNPLTGENYFMLTLTNTV